MSKDSMAQTLNLGTMSFLSTGKKSMTRMSSVDPDKLKKANQIYSSLIAEKGDYRFTVPKLKLSNEASNVAYIDYESNEIVLETRAFDICEQLGDHFIAFILAHELTHYFEKHAWKNEFISRYSDLKIGVELKSVDDQIVNETQADFLGGFLCYSAGYQLTDQIDTVLKSLYKAYEVPDSVPNYPVLSDRVEMTKRSIANLKSFIEVFEMANYLTITGKYKEAMAYYQYILQRYQSHKIYNNIGLVSILTALREFTQKELVFEYPLELENEPIFDRTGETRRDSILKASIRYFDFALGMDPNYLPAKLNKAIAWTLLGELEKAAYFCEQEIMEVADTAQYAKTLYDAWVLNGIILAKKGKKDLAKGMFEKARQNGSQIAAINLERLKNPQATSQLSISRANTEDMVIQGMSLNKFANEPRYDDERIIQIGADYTFYQSQFDSLDYKIFFNNNDVTEIVNYFMVMKPHSTVKTKLNIGNGSSTKDLETAYGKPANRMETSKGTIWLYDQMFFNVNKEGNVIQWGSYLSKKLN